jgi:hypothetical protein
MSSRMSIYRLNSDSRGAKWFRFLVGIVLLGLSAGFFASGYSPPGVFGEVLRHNQQCDIDATPLFYTEVEHMRELEEGITGGDDGED